MNKLIKLIMLGGLMSLPLFSLANAPSVVISEVGWAGSSINSSDEWLELTNLTSATLDLTGWSIAGAATGGDTLSLPDNSQINPKSTYLISNYDYQDERSSLAVPAHFSTSGLSLSNSGLQLVLKNAAGTTVDAAGDGGAPPAGGIEDVATGDGGGKRYLSMVRLAFDLNGATDAAWASATQSSGFMNATADFGSPGQLNLVIPDNIENSENNPIEEENDEPPALVINEIVSDPVEGQEEFIEILNLGNSSVDLSGWSIQDASAKSTLFPEETLVAGGYQVIWKPRGILNNGGDVIELMDPEGAVADCLEYGTQDIPAASDPNALARDPNGQFLVTGTPTPGSANQFSEPLEPEPVVQDPEPVPDPKPEPTESEDPPAQEDPTPVDTPKPAEPNESSENDDPSSENPMEQPTGPDVENEQSETAPSEPTNYTLVLSEIYANTLGNDADEEFIEIHNVGPESINLQGIILEDESGKQYTQSDFYRLAAGGYYALPRSLTKITLNNDGDVIRLFAPDNSLLDQQSYVKTNQGQAWARDQHDWAWTSQITPNEPNRFSSDEVYSEPTQSPLAASPASSTSTRTAGSYSSIRLVDIAQAKELSDNARVLVEGVVTVEPNILGKQIMYISDQEAGVQIYKYDSQYPDLSPGHEVKINGIVSTSHGERRIKITSEGSIQLIGYAAEPVATIFSEPIFTPEDVGRLISVTGTVLSRSGSLILLEANEQEVRIRLASLTDIEPSVFEKGSTVSVTGILTSYDGNYRLSPRTRQDIEIIESAPSEVGAPILSGKTQADSDNQGWGTLLAVITLLTIGGLALRQLINRLRESYVANHPVGSTAQKTG